MLRQTGSLPHWNEVPSTQMQCRMTASFGGDGGPVPSSCLCVWPVAAPRPSARTNASFDAAAYWPPRRDRFAVGDRPIQRYGLWHPSRPTACAVALGSDRHQLMRRFGNGTDHQWYGGRRSPSRRRCRERSSSAASSRQLLPSARPGGPPHQALCRRSHLVTMSELIRLAAQVELFTP